MFVYLKIGVLSLSLDKLSTGSYEPGPGLSFAFYLVIRAFIVILGTESPKFRAIS